MHQRAQMEDTRAALLRVATLVAQGAEHAELFDAIAHEAARVLDVEAVSLLAFDPLAQTLTQLASTHGPRAMTTDGGHWSLCDSPLAARVIQSEAPARIDDWRGLSGPLVERFFEQGFGQAVGAPIVVGGEIWGLITAYGEAGDTLPETSEGQLAEFTRLMATAVSNAQAREELRDLADWQGALRDVATLVAEGVEPQAVFVAVAEHAARIFGVHAVSMVRFDRTTRMYTKIFGTHGERSPVADGNQWSIDHCPEGALILETGGPVRLDDWTVLPGPVAEAHVAAGFGQCVAAPILIDGEIWGHVAAFGERDQRLPRGSELRLADFTDLMASAIANAKIRVELQGLAEQQGAALRRIASLVARQAPPTVIFSEVAREAASALGVERAAVARCGEDGPVLLGTTCGEGHAGAAAEDLALVAQVAEHRGTARAGSAVGAPIFVDGQLWGAITVTGAQPLADDAATRLTDFTHLVASSISNVHARDRLMASRARIVTASDETRRRIERNLHDGVQQRLVGLGLNIRTLQSRFRTSPEMQAALDEIARDIEGVLEEVRVFSQGLHPALLARGGLGPSLRALARRSPIPVETEIATTDRFPEAVETAVYYVVSEALANVAKHAHADHAVVELCEVDGSLRVSISDDGDGGARIGASSGLIGIVDRIEALAGHVTIESPAGAGTQVLIDLPL